MTFETYFRSSAYATIGIAALALVTAGGLHPGLGLLFGILMVLAWNIEGRKWQLSERLGLALVLTSIPLFFIDWQFQKATGQADGRIGVTALAHLIVFLSVIKLLQVKSDRDWVFLLLISFFEILLAAGLSFSPLFLGSLALYLLCALSTVIAFEIRKTRRGVKPAETRLLVPPDSRIFKRIANKSPRSNLEARRLPVVALALLLLIFVLALPLFLIAPRTGSAAIMRGGPGLTNFIGFSETVALGTIGELKQNDEVVMRVRVENLDRRAPQELRWRGVALDEFTGTTWKKSAVARRVEQKTSERGFFQLGTTEALHRLTTQTVFLEPLDSPVLFAAARAVAVQGDFPFIRTDSEGSIQSRHHDYERVMYKAFSDLSEPDANSLRNDALPYSAAVFRYLQLPETFDARINRLASEVIKNSHARNRYDAAKAMEIELQRSYGYSLAMRASGPDPLADFLFNIRSGHCEYFATAMAIMLRTQGIASRVVNGFLPGQYNETADAFTVRQSDAHSWVEVFFPETNTWVTFDPTPPAGRAEPQKNGFAAQLGKYVEALELMWFQYVVGYDRQEQRTLAASMQNELLRYQRFVSVALRVLRQTSWSIMVLFAALLALLFFGWLGFGRFRRFGWRGLFAARAKRDERSAVAFYERLLKVLAERGLIRSPDQTPVEFARSIGAKDVLAITAKYNRVRFGGQGLSAAEVKEINDTLKQLQIGAI